MAPRTSEIRRFLAVALLFAVAPITAAAEQPPSLTPDGGRALPLAARASRGHLLGQIELYTLAIYAETPPSDRTNLSSPDASKALRIELTYQDDLRRRIAVDWRRELVPQLEATAATLLRGTFGGLKHGDVVLVEYVASKGTTVRVNNRVAVSEAGHDLMLTFLDHWLGQKPVSDEIKGELIRSR